MLTCHLLLIDFQHQESCLNLHILVPRRGPLRTTPRLLTSVN
jgi:hypothetical protein